MKQHVIWILLLSAYLLTGGCEIVGVSDDDTLQLQTDATTYPINPETTIRLTVDNRTDADVFVICTGQVFLEEVQGDTVVNTWMVHGFERCYSPSLIAADASHVFEIRLAHVSTQSLESEASYRLAVNLYADAAFNTLVEERYSNRFQLVTP